MFHFTEGKKLNMSIITQRLQKTCDQVSCLQSFGVLPSQMECCNTTSSELKYDGNKAYFRFSL